MKASQRLFSNQTQKVTLNAVILSKLGVCHNHILFRQQALFYFVKGSEIITGWWYLFKEGSLSLKQISDNLLLKSQVFTS